MDNTQGPADVLVCGYVIRVADDQVCSHPTDSVAENITFVEAYYEGLANGDPTVELGEKVGIYISRCHTNPLLPEDEPTAFAVADPSAPPWYYDADNPLTCIAGNQYAHEGKIYICRQWHVANSPTFAPGPSTLALFTVLPTDSSVWEAGVSYAVDDEVFYPTADDTLYRCIQAHTSQVGWEPPNVPALWEVL